MSLGGPFLPTLGSEAQEILGFLEPEKLHTKVRLGHFVQTENVNNTILSKLGH